MQGLGGTSSGGFLMQADPNATVDFHTLKTTKEHTRMMQNRSSGLQSSVSMQRLDRELSPERIRGSTQMIDAED